MEASGRYRGHKDQQGAFTIWDIGTFETVSADEVKLSTANDAVRSYRFSATADVLTFVDPENCTFQYRRLP